MRSDYYKLQRVECLETSRWLTSLIIMTMIRTNIRRIHQLSNLILLLSVALIRMGKCLLSLGKIF